MTKKIKKNIIYIFIIKYLFNPIFSIIWEYLINFEAKILYYLWNIKKKSINHFDLGSNDKLLVENNLNFSEISSKIYENCLPYVEPAKQLLTSEEHKKNMEKEHGKNSAIAETPYRTSLYKNLDKNIKKEIIDFASSDEMLATAMKYMKIFPILTRVQVGLNIPREGSQMRGAMFWHRDTFGYKNLEFFMYLTDVDDENAPFYFLKKKIKASTFMSFDKLRPGNKLGERGKVDIDEFSKYFKDDQILKMIGKKGTAVFLDSFSTYHRGGYCKSKERIMLRFCYQSHDAQYDQDFNQNDVYKFYEDLNINNVKNYFLKYLFFKKKTTFMRYLTKFLLKFYRKIDYYVS